MEKDVPAGSARKWQVALSFAGAQRPYVEQVATALQARGLRCFYDADQQVELWGRHLTEELPRIYAEHAAVVVMFISADYAARDWTNLERRAALTRAVKERREYVLPARFDDTELPGLLPDLVFLELSRLTPTQFSEMIVAKLGQLGICPSSAAEDSATTGDARQAALPPARRSWQRRWPAAAIAGVVVAGAVTVVLSERAHHTSERARHSATDAFLAAPSKSFLQTSPWRLAVHGSGCEVQITKKDNNTWERGVGGDDFEVQVRDSGRFYYQFSKESKPYCRAKDLRGDGGRQKLPFTLTRRNPESKPIAAGQHITIDTSSPGSGCTIEMRESAGGTVTLSRDAKENQPLHIDRILPESEWLTLDGGCLARVKRAHGAAGRRPSASTGSAVG